MPKHDKRSMLIPLSELNDPSEEDFLPQDDGSFYDTYLKRVLKNAQVVLWSINVETGRVTYCSDSVERLYGVSSSDVVRNWNWKTYVYRDDHRRFIDALHRAAKGHFTNVEYRIRRPDGRVYWVESSLSPGMDSNGIISVVDGTTIDITARKFSDTKLVEHQRRFDALLHLIPDSVVIHRDGVIQYANQSTLIAMGVSPDRNPVGASVWQFIDASLHHDVEQRHRDLLERRDVPGMVELTFKRADGTTFVGEARSVLIEDENGLAILSVIRDITEHKRLTDELEHMAFHDYLTGLANRRSFVDHFTQVIDDSKCFESTHAVLLLDIDRFKKINDSYGHDCGDRVLSHMADRLKTVVGKKHFVARVGGDEFSILCRDVSEDEATTIADEVLDTLSAPLCIGGRAFHVMPSIGIAMYPSCGLDVTTLLKHADVAMYSVKTRGGNQIAHYQMGQERHIERELSLESSLRRALDNEEFCLEFQPKVDLVTGNVASVEALIRWNTKVEGYIPPEQFIPVAEDIGLIAQIGEWVLGEACRQNMDWQRSGYAPMTISVNVSPKQFLVQDVYQLVVDVLQETGLQPQWLAIEVTEGVLLENPHDVLETVQKLRDLGVKIAIDDFGSGYSALRYLRLLKATHLKIDRSFVKWMLDDGASMAIVSYVIQLGHRLGMTVIAEGVETKEQLECLRLEGCDLVQGFYVSQPVSSDIIERSWLTTQH